MPMSEHLRRIRERVGHDLLLIPGVTGLVYDDGGRMLLVYENLAGGWAPPGGAIEPGEAPYDAVMREVLEETGLAVEPIALRGVFGGDPMRVRYPNGDQVEYVSAMFECAVRGGALRADGVEVGEARFVAPSEIARLPLVRWASLLLPELLRERGRARLR
jgi:8-oxo-dGTP pyrophosphatase MutT (NUDIX family)